MTKDSSLTDRKTLTLNFDKGKEPASIQEKLQQLKDLYATGSKPAKVTQNKKKGVPSKAVSPKNASQAEKGNKANSKEKSLQEVRAIKIAARRKKFKQLQLALDWLKETYPLCFKKNEPVPLKKRIEKDIFAVLPDNLPFSKVSIRDAIRFYAHWNQYQTALITASHRYNLQGEAVEEVTEHEKEFARQQLPTPKAH
ncbi:ProQ/FINO family protein [Candidatus Paracaedibacter symbiosus]|uniref:ProQ/FINO family protein n=1 Tax=Candidatus Paracaedibacter symbiosus TaxID=244582 RepID=UPI000509DD17|nr:ProQ/FinO family protein [Candidatus Paracaedibacter symbiosus]